MGLLDIRAVGDGLAFPRYEYEALREPELDEGDGLM